MLQKMQARIGGGPGRFWSIREAETKLDSEVERHKVRQQT
jgi:hypothetical protein